MARGSKLSVTMDDGAGGERVLEVVADQRDWAIWEAHPDNVEGRHLAVTQQRALAFSAMKRAGLTDCVWRVFNEQRCIDVQFLGTVGAPESEEGEGEEGLDPGRS